MAKITSVNVKGRELIAGIQSIAIMNEIRANQDLNLIEMDAPGLQKAFDDSVNDMEEHIYDLSNEYIITTLLPDDLRVRLLIEQTPDYFSFSLIDSNGIAHRAVACPITFLRTPLNESMHGRLLSADAPLAPIIDYLNEEPGLGIVQQSGDPASMRRLEAHIRSAIQIPVFASYVSHIAGPVPNPPKAE